MTKKLKAELEREDAERKQMTFDGGKRGAVIKRGRKVPITIRLDPDVLQWFRDQVTGGGSYQTLINEALREHIAGKGLDDQIRSAIREELAGLKAG
ncbi:MAG: BrnA antitoxin family protein [Nitrospirota bacterium]|nr:BrnA antitoxin family protein [Nitrospirota bacterium]